MNEMEGRKEGLRRCRQIGEDKERVRGGEEGRGD